MPDPAELLAAARLLSDPSGRGPASDARLRRAVSTAYYALFHKVLRIAAKRFLGPGHESAAGFAVLYRGFDHRRMRTTCEAIQASTLNDRYRSLLRRPSMSEEMRDFARVFIELQDARHAADYDPAAEFLPSDVSALIDAAEAAMDAFDRTAPDERTDVLALMMAGTRG